ncbi:MAG: DUF1080 domain-containing protein [Verrucomicrobiales bacterium]|nr:DUF1080 domain-containing protein [Verrucomicrobiales bacterium]
MKSLFISVAAAAALLSFAGAEEAGFVPIFNGENLEGWEWRAGAWEVQDGEIRCTGKDKEKNWLIWRKEEPENFILKLEFKWQAGNSGVQVRSDDLGDYQIFGYQVEVARQEVMGLWHHSLLEKDHPRKTERHLMATAGQAVTIAKDGSKTVEQVGDAEELKSLVKEHGWNELSIVAKGNKIIQKINGVVFSTVIDNDEEMSRRKGFIALQDHGKGCLVAFRNLRLKTLP